MKPSQKQTILKRHHEMVTDTKRTPLIEKAIKEIVKKNHTVLEIGAGTGVLTLKALEAGAEKIYACEIDASIKIAQEKISKAGFSKKAVFHKGLSSDFEIPEKVDVIISETVGSLGFNENILPYLIEARKLHLKTDGHIIPAKLSLFLAPTSYPINLKQTQANGAIQSAFHIELIPTQSLLSAEQLYFKADFKKIKNVGFDIEKKFSFQKAGTIYGMAGWISIEWAPGICTDTSPFHDPTHWKQSYLPLEKSILVKAGQEFLFRLRIGPDPENPLEALIEWGYKVINLS